MFGAHFGICGSVRNYSILVSVERATPIPTSLIILHLQIFCYTIVCIFVFLKTAQELKTLHISNEPSRDNNAISKTIPTSFLTALATNDTKSFCKNCILCIRICGYIFVLEFVSPNYAHFIFVCLALCFPVGLLYNAFTLKDSANKGIKLVSSRKFLEWGLM